MNLKKTLFLTVIIGGLLTLSGFQDPPDHKVLFEKAKFTMETKGDLNGAISLFNVIIRKYPKEREYAAKSQLYIGLCYEKLGFKEAQKAFQKVISSYPEQTEAVRLAHEKLNLLLKAENVVAREENEFRIRRIKEDLDLNVPGPISPDGRYILYADDALDLAVYEFSTGKKRVLFRGDIYSDAYSSLWSPDGKMVAFTWYDRGKMDLRIVGTDGTGYRILFSDASVSYLHAEDWSPDGKSILAIVYRKDKTSQMILVSVDNGSVRELKNFGKLELGSSRFSPDGRYIAFTNQQNSESKEKDIFTLPLDGGKEMSLVIDPADDIVLDWTPDGRAILFRSNRTGTMGAWWIQVNEGRPAGTPELVRPDLERDFNPVGFIGCNSYYFTTQKEMSDVFIAEIDFMTGKLLSNPVLATQSFSGSNHGPDWSADGRELVYLSQRSPEAWGARTICIRSSESGKVRELTCRLNQLSWIRWSPDGTFLLAAGGHPDGGYGIFRIDTQTGAFEPLLRSHIGWPAAWSRDGKAIFSCHDTTAGRIPIVKWNLENHKEMQLYNLSDDSSYYTSGLTLSPGGQYLAFSVSESGSKTIRILPVNGKKSNELLREDKTSMPFAFGFGTVAWTSDGRNVLFVRQPSSGSSDRELWLIPAESGNPRKLGLRAENMRELSVHPDGKQIAFTAGKIRAEIWVMENFLPKQKFPVIVSGMNFSRIWAGPDVDLEGSVSPDGRCIAYIDWNTGDLALRDLEKGENRKLTKNPIGAAEYADFAVFSPDGKEVAYAWCDKDGYYDLRAVRIDGSNPRIIYHNREVSYFLPQAWSKDGKYILSIISKAKTFAIALASTSDSTLRILKSIPGWRFPQMSLSPNGQWIAYDLDSDENPGKHDIYLIRTDGSHDVRLINHPANDLWPVWAPDGKQLLFASDRGGTLGLWSVTVNDDAVLGQPVLIKPDIGRIRPFGFTDYGSFFYGLTAGTGEVYTADIDPVNKKLISSPVPAMKSYLGFNGTPDFSPDGEYLACLSLRGYNTGLQPGNRSIIIRQLKTGEEKEIPLNFAPGWELKWSPDSRSVLIPGVDIKKTFNLYQIDVITKEMWQLGISTGFNNRDGSQRGWFPDQNSLYMIAGAPKNADGISQMRLVRYLLDKKEMQDIFLYKPDETRLNWVTLSPDGKQFAAWKNNPRTGSFSLLLIPSDGGGSNEVPVLKQENGFEKGWEPKGLAWTPDGQQLLFAAKLSSKEKAMSLWKLNVEKGNSVLMGELPDKVYGLSVHPSGKQLVFSTMEDKFEVWALGNFLPKPKTEERVQLTMRKLDYPQLNTPYARLSPDGRKIAHVIYVGGSPKGFDLLDLVSGTSKILFDKNTGDPSHIAWSPQSDKIAHAFQGKELHVCDIIGINKQVIMKNNDYKIYPFDWSRDGKKIVCFFEGDYRKVGIGIVDLNGQVKFLESGIGTDFNPASEPRISPDGAYVACSQGERGSNTDIYVWSTDGDRKVQITSHPGRDESPVWSHDGKYLIFLSDRNRTADLWGVQMKDGTSIGAPFIVKKDLGWQTEIKDLTSDGKLFLSMLGGSEPAALYNIPVDQGDANLSGPIAPVSVYPTAHTFPRYSPDGKKIAFLSRRGQINMPKLYVLDENSVEKEFPLQGHYATNIDWHPDNKSVLFTGWDKNNNSGVFKVILGNGEVEQVFSGGTFDMKTLKGGIVNINLLANTGKIMFFRFLDRQNVEVLTCNPDGQQQTTVLLKVRMPIWGIPSPDGENICYRLGDSLMVVSVSDGSPKYIGSSTVNLEATWSPDGNNLLFRDGSSLRDYSVKEMKTHTLYQAAAGKTIGGMEMYGNTWSPNGKCIIITEQDTSATSSFPQKLILINAYDGSGKTLGTAPEGYRLSQLRWSPDGSKVMATCNSIRKVPASGYEYWVLENFLPK